MWKSFSVQSCSKLAMVCATRDKASTKEFITSLTKVAPHSGHDYEQAHDVPLVRQQASLLHAGSGQGHRGQPQHRDG